jgi:hypothetical protein
MRFCQEKTGVHAVPKQSRFGLESINAICMHKRKNRLFSQKKALGPESEGLRFILQMLKQSELNDGRIFLVCASTN